MARRNMIRYLVHKRIFDFGGSGGIIIPKEVREQLKFMDKNLTYSIEFALIDGEPDLHIKMTKEEKK